MRLPSDGERVDLCTLLHGINQPVRLATATGPGLRRVFRIAVFDLARTLPAITFTEEILEAEAGLFGHNDDYLALTQTVTDCLSIYLLS